MLIACFGSVDPEEVAQGEQIRYMSAGDSKQTQSETLNFELEHSDVNSFYHKHQKYEAHSSESNSVD